MENMTLKEILFHHAHEKYEYLRLCELKVQQDLTLRDLVEKQQAQDCCDIIFQLIAEAGLSDEFWAWYEPEGCWMK